MNHLDYAVDVLNQAGAIMGQKPRNQINKQTDIYHSVHVILVTPKNEAVLSIIPEREDLPNLYAGLLGTTMATIRHHGETAEQAATRGLKRELSLDTPQLIPVFDSFTTLSDGHQSHVTAFKVVAERPEQYQELHTGTLMPIDPDGVDVGLARRVERFAPTLAAIWPSLQVVS